MALTLGAGALMAMGLTAAEAASIAAAAAAASAGTAAAAGAGAGAAGALGAGAAGAGALGAGAGAGAGAASAIPAAAAIAPEAASLSSMVGPAMGAGVEGGTGALAPSALPIGPAMGEGVEGGLMPSNTATPPAWYDKFFSGAKSMGQDMMPKSTTDYLKLGQAGSQMMGGGGHAPAPQPPPLMRPQGSAIPMGDPQRLKALTVNGGGNAINPQIMALLAKMAGGGR